MLFPPNKNIDPTCAISVKNFLDENEIQKLNKVLENIPLKKAGVWDEAKNPNQRRSKVKWIDPTPDLSWFYIKLKDLLTQTNDSTWGFDIPGVFENLQYVEYHSDDLGHFEWHVDLGQNYASFRKISITIQLSHPSEYEGGNLETFTGGDYNDPNSRKQCPKDKGLAFLFPTFLLHRVTPVTKGIRKALVIWVGGTPFR